MAVSTELQGAIERKRATLKGGADAGCVELSRRTVFNLLCWFTGNPYTGDPETVRLALDVLAWCDEFSGLAPDRSEREAQLRCAATTFELAQEQLLNLADTSRELLRLGKHRKSLMIALEGIDGSGKSRQLELLRRSLSYQDGRTQTLSFPRYDTFFGREVADLLMGRHALGANRLDSKSMALWYALDRWRTFRESASDHSEYLLIDRFTLSNAVYQAIRTPGSEDALVDWILHLEHVELGLPVPDIYIVLDVSPEMARANILQKGFRQYSGSDSDVYERSDDLLTLARSQYLRLADKFYGIRVIDCMIGAQRMKTPEAIHDQILTCLEQCQITVTTP